MLKRTKGIVLKSTVFGEADLIVSYLTPDFGVMKVFAKSPRKIKSRFGSSLEPLTYSKISFLGKEESNLPRLTQSDIIRPFHALREDFGAYVSISEMLEMNLAFLAERDPHSDIFMLFLTTLSKLEGDSSKALYYLYYKIKFLEMTGYSPKLDSCGRCGSEEGMSGHYDFYLFHGSLICPRCRCEGDESIRMSASALKFYRSLLNWNSSVIDRVNAPESLVKEIGGMINAHIRYSLGPTRVLSHKYQGNAAP